MKWFEKHPFGRMGSGYFSVDAIYGHTVSEYQTSDSEVCDPAGTGIIYKIIVPFVNPV